MTTAKSRILVVVGPTAAGKSALGVRLAQLLGGEIISADSRQIYSDLTIGTAKPSERQREGIPHHLIDCFPIEKHFTAGQFKEIADTIIDDMLSKNRVPIIVGGSGLYIQALVDGMFESADAPGEIRERLYRRLKNEGGGVLLAELQVVDPAIAQTMNPKTTHRIIRALEVYENTGIPLSKHHSFQNRESRYDPFFVGLDWDRRQLYDRINTRVDTMIGHGLIDEVRQLKDRGYDDSLQALQTVGYQEVFPFFRGEYSDAEMIRLIKRNTRRYAKRQLTWFRRNKRIHWYPIANENDIDAISHTVAAEFRSMA